MSDVQPEREAPRPRTRCARGQSLVEFALVLPILLILLLTVADFGRLFAMGITIESAARAGAETAAAEYLLEEITRDPLTPIDAAGYARIHEVAWRSVCDEAATLPNATPSSGGQCDGLPTVVCVHDGVDPGCGNAYNAASGIPVGCPALHPAARPTNAQTGGSEISRYVEVRVCYRFSTILELTIPTTGGSITLLGGDFFLERTRTFTVADY